MDAEGHHAAARSGARVAQQRIVDVEEQGAGFGESGNDGKLFVADGFFAAEMFQMRPADIGDHRQVGARGFAEHADLARMVGAHFQHGKAMGTPQLKQRQRHADMIVEIAFGGERLARTAQHRGDHVLGGGLAVAARHRDFGDAEARGIGLRQRQQRLSRVAHGHIDPHRLAILFVPFAFHHGRQPSFLKALFHIRMPVEIRTP